MKRITLLLTGIFLSLMSFSQYYYIPETSPGENPGGLNTESEYPLGSGLSSSWTTILDGVTSAVWSTNQTIPFSFDFNGSPVTEYKVSSSGILTFTTSATGVPGFTNAALPEASIPDASVCIWGIEGTGSNDAIVTQTFGTAPNRQHWIFFASYTASGTWSYWSIVLEETTNNIYIVDQRHGGTISGLTLGIQIDGSNAVSVSGSPNVSSIAGSDATPADNAYYTFIQGTQLAYDLRVTQTDLNEFITVGNNTVTGKIQNLGSTTITSFDLVYVVNGGTPVSATISSVNISPLGEYSFTHPTPLNATSGGSFYDLCIYANNLNGSNADENNSNDTLCVNPICINGTSGTKHTLIEEFTTAACGFCPDGHTVLNDILTTYPNAVGVCHHAGYGTDAMTIQANSDYASVFATGAPTAAIDRGENIGLSRGDWEQITVDQLARWTPCDVAVTGTYNSTTRDLSADVSVDFTDYAVSGDLRITMFIVEDSVTGTGSGYDQTNYYNTTTGSPYYGLGNPIIGYVHRHVVREVLPTSSIWGVSGTILSSPQPSDNYSYNFTETLDTAWNDNQVSLVAFVSYYNSNTTKRDILNVIEVKLSDLGTDVNEFSDNYKISNIYPNPTNDKTYINVNLNKTSNVIINVRNLLGKTVYTYNNAISGNNKIALETGNLANGVYLVEINIDNKKITQKLIISK